METRKRASCNLTETAATLPLKRRREGDAGGSQTVGGKSTNGDKPTEIRRLRCPVGMEGELCQIPPGNRLAYYAMKVVFASLGLCSVRQVEIDQHAGFGRYTIHPTASQFEHGVWQLHQSREAPGMWISHLLLPQQHPYQVDPVDGKPMVMLLLAAYVDVPAVALSDLSLLQRGPSWYSIDEPLAKMLSRSELPFDQAVQHAHPSGEAPTVGVQIYGNPEETRVEYLVRHANYICDREQPIERDPFFADYLHRGGLLLLKAPPSSGKTTVIDKLWDHVERGRPGSKMVIVVPTVSLMQDRLEKLSRRYPTADMANVGSIGQHMLSEQDERRETVGGIRQVGDVVLTTRESLGLLADVQCSMLVFDEAHTIFDGFDSETMMSNRYTVLTRLWELALSTEYVIMADAHLEDFDGRVAHWIAKGRERHTSANLMLLHVMSPAPKRQWLLDNDEDQWTREMLADVLKARRMPVHQRRPVAVAFQNMSDASAFALKLQTRAGLYEPTDILLLTADTYYRAMLSWWDVARQEFVEQAKMLDYDTLVRQYALIIYTPKLGPGVDIVTPFTSVWGVPSEGSGGPLGFVQMMYRIRNPDTAALRVLLKEGDLRNAFTAALGSEDADHTFTPNAETYVGSGVSSLISDAELEAIRQYTWRRVAEKDVFWQTILQCLDIPLKGVSAGDFQVPHGLLRHPRQGFQFAFHQQWSRKCLQKPSLSAVLYARRFVDTVHTDGDTLAASWLLPGLQHIMLPQYTYDLRKTLDKIASSATSLHPPTPAVGAASPTPPMEVTMATTTAQETTSATMTEPTQTVPPSSPGEACLASARHHDPKMAAPRQLMRREREEMDIDWSCVTRQQVERLFTYQRQGNISAGERAAIERVRLCAAIGLDFDEEPDMLTLAENRGRFERFRDALLQSQWIFDASTMQMIQVGEAYDGAARQYDDESLNLRDDGGTITTACHKQTWFDHHQWMHFLPFYLYVMTGVDPIQWILDPRANDDDEFVVEPQNCTLAVISHRVLENENRNRYKATMMMYYLRHSAPDVWQSTNVTLGSEPINPTPIANNKICAMISAANRVFGLSFPTPSCRRPNTPCPPRNDFVREAMKACRRFARRHQCRPNAAFVLKHVEESQRSVYCPPIRAYMDM